MNRDLKMNQTSTRPPTPLSRTLTTSSTTLSLDGEPPFTTTTTFKSTAIKPIWIHFFRLVYVSKGIDIADPSRKIGMCYRPLAPMSSPRWDDWGEEMEGHELVRLAPGQEFSVSYTVAVTPSLEGLRGPKAYAAMDGNEYSIGATHKRVKWLFEDEMGDGELTTEERITMLRKNIPEAWEDDCRVTFVAFVGTKPVTQLLEDFTL